MLLAIVFRSRILTSPGLPRKKKKTTQMRAKIIFQWFLKSQTFCDYQFMQPLSQKTFPPGASWAASRAPRATCVFCFYWSKRGPLWIRGHNCVRRQKVQSVTPRFKFSSTRNCSVTESAFIFIFIVEFENVWPGWVPAGLSLIRRLCARGKPDYLWNVEETKKTSRDWKQTSSTISYCSGAFFKSWTIL